VTFGGEPLLEEQDLGVMVGVLGVDVATASPRGNDVEWHAESRTGVDVSFVAVRVFYPLTLGTIRRVEWDDVVSPATSLVVADNQSGLVVAFTVDNGIDDLLLQPCTVLWLVWLVLTKFGRADDVGDSWECTGGGAVVKVLKANIGHTLATESAGVGGDLVLLEPGKWVVVKVVGVLVDLP